MLFAFQYIKNEAENMPLSAMNDLTTQITRILRLPAIIEDFYFVTIKKFIAAAKLIDWLKENVKGANRLIVYWSHNCLYEEGARLNKRIITCLVVTIWKVIRSWMNRWRGVELTTGIWLTIYHVCFSLQTVSHRLSPGCFTRRRDD